MIRIQINSPSARSSSLRSLTRIILISSATRLECSNKSNVKKPLAKATMMKMLSKCRLRAVSNKSSKMKNMLKMMTKTTPTNSKSCKCSPTRNTRSNWQDKSKTPTSIKRDDDPKLAWKLVLVKMLKKNFISLVLPRPWSPRKTLLQRKDSSSQLGPSSKTWTKCSSNCHLVQRIWILNSCSSYCYNNNSSNRL